MELKPNIDRNGRIARAISGALCIAAGLALVVAGWPQAAVARWLLAAALVLAGGFQLFEAKHSWCVMRACGVKTPM